VLYLIPIEYEPHHHPITTLQRRNETNDLFTLLEVKQ
jgi:hypothetical protein